MPMQAVEAPKKRSFVKSGRDHKEVHSIKDITRIKERLPHRRQLPDDVLKSFVDAINSACDSGELPYVNYRLDQEGSPHTTLAHYWCHELDPVYIDTAKKLALRDKIPFEEAWKYLEMRLLKKKMAGLAFLLTNDCKKFWYLPGDAKVEAVLYHDWERSKYTPDEMALIKKMKKLLAPGQEEKLLKELRN